MEPDGRPPDRPETGVVHASASTAAKMAAQKAAKARTFLCLNRNLHLGDGIGEVPTRIPRRSLRLRPALAVTGSRPDCVFPGTRSMPGIISPTAIVLGLSSCKLRTGPLPTSV